MNGRLEPETNQFNFWWYSFESLGCQLSRHEASIACRINGRKSYFLLFTEEKLREKSTVITPNRNLRSIYYNYIQKVSDSVWSIRSMDHSLLLTSLQVTRVLKAMRNRKCILYGYRIVSSFTEVT